MASKVYDVRSVADYLVRKAGPRGLDPLQIMKLVYLCHGFKLGLFGEPLFKEDVEAWRYGPVIRKLYKALPSGPACVQGGLAAPEVEFEPEDITIMDQVFDKYGSLSGIRLSSMTHQPGSPWSETWERYGMNTVIPQEEIAQHYREIVAGQ